MKEAIKWIRDKGLLITGLAGLIVTGLSSIPVDIPGLNDSARIIMVLGLVSALSVLIALEDHEKQDTENILIDIKNNMEINYSNAALIREIRKGIKCLPKKSTGLTEFFGSYVVDRIETMLIQDFFDIENGQVFQDFYRSTFRNLQACEVIATAYPRKIYMWNANDINRVFADFVKRGGKITRIFILEAEAELNDPEVFDIMEQQARAGVLVWSVLKRDINAVVRMVFADTERQFSWEITVHGMNNSIDRANVSWNDRACDDRLRYLEGVMRYAKPFTIPVAPTAIS